MFTGVAKEQIPLLPTGSPIPPASVAKLISLDEKIPLPREFCERLVNSDLRAVVILAPRTPAIIVTTVESSFIFKVTIEVDYLSPEFLPDLDAMLEKLDIRSRVLLNNGLRFEGFTCVNELYLEPAIPENRLKEEIQTIKDVSQVTIERIVPEQVTRPAVAGTK
ncbi:MAG: hypothetical protein ACFFD4_18230 [Candidatus Odinarchaeota archaeon]